MRQNEYAKKCQITLISKPQDDIDMPRIIVKERRKTDVYIVRYDIVNFDNVIIR
jgi:hypothetical protein